MALKLLVTILAILQFFLQTTSARPGPPFSSRTNTVAAPSPSISNTNVKGSKDRSTKIAFSINPMLDPRLVQAELFPRTITVHQNGTGDFTTVQGAIDSIQERNKRRTYIKIGPGVYREKVHVEKFKPFITLQGDPDAMPTITFNDTAARIGTAKSASVTVESDYFVAHNIVFENSAPKPDFKKPGGQAVALKISGDKAAFYNCRFYGFQDTLYDSSGRHLFKDCYIRGIVDFIFGNGRSIYLNCTIESMADGGTFLTAQARTRKDEQSGFAFIRCRIIGTGNAYLGRAWRESSRVVFAYTYMGNLINPQGWHDFGIPRRQKSVFYGEYKCGGPGADRNKRVSYAKALMKDEVKPFLDVSFIDGKSWLSPTPILVEDRLDI